PYGDGEGLESPRRTGPAERPLPSPSGNSQRESGLRSFAALDYSRDLSVSRRRHLSRDCQPPRFGKPVVMDEYCHEGANGTGFGTLSGMEEIEAQWNVTMAGAYGSHGDCYVHPGDILWWAVGGDLDGDSPARYGFLRKLMREAPFAEMAPMPGQI